MDKKTKLWLGVGVVGVGAYLLWKSKQPKATTAVDTAAATTAKAGFLAGDRQISQDGTQFFGHQRMMNQTGMINSLDTERTKFNQTGATLGGNSFDVKGAKTGSQNSGIFANKPFVGDVANMVGASGEKVFANADSASGRFFDPRTARYGQNQGVFAPSKPKIKTPVEPVMPIKEVKQAAPLNNLVGADGGFFKVHDGFGK